MLLIRKYFKLITHNVLNKTLALVLVLQLALASPFMAVTYADEAGDNQQSAEAQEKLAKNTKTAETVKVCLFTAGTLVAVAMAVLEDVVYTTAYAKAVCSGIGIAIPIAGTVTDVAVSVSNGKITSGAMSSMTSLMGAAMNVTAFQDSMKAVKNATSNMAKESGSQTTKEAEEKSGCLMTAAMLGLSAALSGVGLAYASKAEKMTHAVVEEIKKDKEAKIKTDFNSNAGNAPQQKQLGLNSRLEANQVTDSASEGCDKKAGRAYLACVGQTDPSIAKMVANNDYMNMMDKLLHKDVGDFVKAAPSDPDAMPSYVSSALGFGEKGASYAKKLISDMDRIAKEKGLSSSSTYSVAGLKKTSSTDEPTPDFNKMMQDLLKQMNPGAAEGKKKEDAAEVVFRQMELLPPEKLLERKEVSLFARVGFRYRKSADKLESLNWSAEGNQQK